MPIRSFRGSIRQKLAVLFLISALPALLLIVFLGVQSKNRSIAEAKHDLLDFILHAAASQEQSIASTRLLLANLSKLPAVQQGDAETCNRIFANILVINQQRYGAIHLVDPHGNIIASSAKSNMDINFAQTKHFIDAVAAKDFAVGEYQLGLTLKVPVIPFGHAVIGEDQQVRGVLLTSVLLSDYVKPFHDMRVPDNSFFGVADHRGVRLFRFPETSLAPIGKNIDKGVFETAKAGLPDGLTEYIGADGIKRIIAYRHLRIAPDKPLYLYMFIGVPKASIIASAWETLVRDLGILLLILVLTLISGWYLGGKTMGHHLEHMAVAAKHIGQGDMDVRVEPTSGIDEIDILSKSFNNMVEALAKDREARARYAEELREARGQAEEANRAKSMFLANMSHELRTPLNGLLGMLQLLQYGSLSGEQAEYVEMASRSGRRLAKLIGDILDLARIESGRMPLSLKPFQLGDVFAALTETFSPMQHEKKLGFSITCAPDVPPILFGDETRVTQILFNIVGNAMKFTEQGQVHIEVNQLLQSPSGDSRVLFAISDTGVGIPDDKIDGICAPFTQVTETLTRQHQGAGLGLAIARQLVIAMGGTLTFESTIDEGTSAYLVLPFARLEETAEAAPAMASVSPLQEESLSLLIVEDEYINRVGGRLMVQKLGHRADVAANGIEALAMLKDTDYDCVLMDIQMDTMDGVEATRLIRAGSHGVRNPGIPIIAMTAYAVAGDKERFLEAGMNYYISKPVMTHTLCEALKAVVPPKKVAPSQA